MISANVASLPFPFEEWPELIDIERCLDNCPADIAATMVSFRYRWMRSLTASRAVGGLQNRADQGLRPSIFSRHMELLAARRRF